MLVLVYGRFVNYIETKTTYCPQIVGAVYADILPNSSATFLHLVDNGIVGGIYVAAIIHIKDA